MKTAQNDPCRAVRGKWSNRMDSIFNRAFGSFLRNHIEHCPRCSRRLMNLGRVEWAILMTKSQSHNADLVARANTAALHMLKHSLRFAPKAETLRAARPETGWFIRHSIGVEKVFNIAACLMVLAMIKFGTTSEAFCPGWT